MSALKYPRVAGFYLTEEIGGGGFSKVYRATDLENHRTAACKVVLLTPETSAQDRKMLDKEIRVHSAMKHVNVLEFLNAVIVESDGKTKYIPGIYMLLELASGGDLFDKIAPDVGLDDEIAQFYFNQLVAGLSYIHNQGVCHRDLKPENLLLDIAGRLKISDFGLCSVFRHKESGKIRMLTERCGSLPYVAPELNSNDPYHAEPVDVWGAGVILFTLLAGNTPWDEPTANSPEFCRYANGTIFQEAPWNRINKQAMSLITALLAINPRERVKLSDIPNHGWCLRPSQIGQEGSVILAERLTQSLQANGDIAFINAGVGVQGSVDDGDGDTVMMSASCKSQFTQSLMLFSQTQSGQRYTPHLTRFYSRLAPNGLMPLIMQSLQNLGVKCKAAEQPPGSHSLRLRVGGFDRRKEMFKGWVEVENFSYRGDEGSFCVMQRDQGNPISWRQLWKALITSPEVETYVLRR
ncbi:CAMK/CAMKL/CHK1 protein kinase [Rickenella mellea]|uniref:non-specific serine/threonine protein kinase n=1 Tax=Rickenella mellea TaxID=50990 RepID=A0A4Y7PYY5_9AGAM|nr:CAMK/CAMKL/CHK1 protein kinase [Rickenella mellea]